jgi:hypothetical protein
MLGRQSLSNDYFGEYSFGTWSFSNLQLCFTPGTWVKRIYKGGSVVNKLYESISGQINTESKANHEYTIF